MPRPMPPPPDDDDIPMVVQTTLGPLRLARRSSGPSRGETDDVSASAPPTWETIHDDRQRGPRFPSDEQGG